MKPHRSPRFATLLTGSVAALLASQSAQAAGPYYWDNNGGTDGFGTAAGTWAAPTTGDASQGWSTDGTGATLPVNVTTATNDSINFGNGATGLGAGTVTVSGTVESGNITFGSASGTIVLSGGILNLAATSTITVDNSSDIISSKIIGAGTSLIKAGNGTLTLSGDNNFAGGLNFLAGALNINSNTALGAGGLGINSGGTIDNTSGGLVTISNNIISSVNTTFGGSNALTTTGSYTYNNNNRVLQLNGSGAFTVGTFANSGGNKLRKRGSGTLAITGAWTSGAGIEFEGNQNAGTVLIGNKASLGTGSLDVFSGGSAALKSSTTLTGSDKVANAVNLAGVLTLGGSFDFEMGGVISSSGYLAKSDANTVILSGANTYSGATTVNAGTLKAGVASVANTSGAFGLNSAVSLANSAGVVLDLNGYNNTIGSLSGGGTTGGTVALGSNNLTIKATTNNQTYNGLFTGAGNIIVDAATATNQVNFGGTDTAASGTGYTGNVSVNSGTLQLGRTHNILGTNVATTQTVVVANGAAVNLAYGEGAYNHAQNFVINGTGTAVAGNAALSGTLLRYGSATIGGLAVASDATIRTTMHTASENRGVNVTRGLVGTGKLTKTGNGYLYLNAAAPTSPVTWAGTSYSGFTGDVDVTAGVIQLTNVSHVLGTNTAGTQLVTISSGAAVVLNAGNGAYTANQNFVLNGAGTGQAANLGGLAALELSNVNYSNQQIRGIAVATDSTISVNRNGSAANTFGLDVNGPLAGTGTLTVTSSNASGSNATLYLKAAAGTVGGYSAFTGNVNVRNGARLASNHATALGTTANVDLADGTVLSIGASQTLGGLTNTTTTTNTGSVLLNSQTLTIGSTNNLSGTFSGVISNGTGAGGIIKDGTGTLSLTGTNTYTGTTSIAKGKLIMGDAASDTFATSGVTVASGATLGGSGTISGTVGVTGILAPGIAGVSGGIGTLNAGTTTWNGGDDSANTIWQFDLGANGASDKLNINGDFVKSGSGTYKFDFMGSTPTWGSTYTLVDWSGSLTGFNVNASDFSFTGLSSFWGPSTFAIDTTNKWLTFTAVPEPTSALAGLLITAGLLRRRRAS